MRFFLHFTMENPRVFSTMLEFEEQFKTEEDCYEYLKQHKWAKGYCCPKCEHDRAWISATGNTVCQECEHHNSLTAGTIFHGTSKPLMLWFRAIWYITEQKNGVSALGLQRAIGLGSYHTAWAWLHKLRCAMVNPDRDRLSGVVEVDEAFYGGAKKGKGGRGAEGKVLILIATENNNDAPGRIRMVEIPDASGDSLISAIQEMVELGSTIQTDGWKGYSKLNQKGYTREVIPRENTNPGESLLPLADLNISLFKRWALGTHQGAIGHDHIGYYMDEFTFRYNRRKSKNRGLLFQRLVENAVRIDPIPESLLVGGNYDIHHN